MEQDKQFFEAMRKAQMEQKPSPQQLFLINLIEKNTTAKFNGNSAYIAAQFINRNWNKFNKQYDVTLLQPTEHENVTVTTQQVPEQDKVINFRGRLLKAAKLVKTINFNGVTLKAKGGM